jgi:hypothetical protein
VEVVEVVLFHHVQGLTDGVQTPCSTTAPTEP